MISFWRNIAYVLSGSVLAQLIPIIASFFLARIFSPDVFGEYSVWLGGVLFCATFITLRLEAALVLIGNTAERKRAVLFIVILCAFISLLLIAVSFVVFALNFSWLKLFNSNFYLVILLVLASFSLAMNLIWQSWAVADGSYGILNSIRIFQALIVSALQVASGLFIPDTFSLALSFFVANLISFFLAMIIMPNVFRFGFCFWNEFKAFFIRYKNFPSYSLPADSINSAAVQLPLLIVAFRFDTEAAGYLALTMRVLGAPIGLAGKAVLDVFKKKAIDDICLMGNCKNLYISTFKILSLLSFFMVICTVYFAGYIFETAFGPEWRESGTIAVWLLPMFALRFVASPLSYMVYLVERQNLDLFWQVGLMVMTVITLFSLVDYKNTLVFYSWGYCLMYCFYLHLSYRLSKG